RRSPNRRVSRAVIPAPFVSAAAGAPFLPAEAGTKLPGWPLSGLPAKQKHILYMATTFSICYGKVAPRNPVASEWDLSKGRTKNGALSHSLSPVLVVTKPLRIGPRILYYQRRRSTAVLSALC